VAEALLQQNDWALFREFVEGHPECAEWLRDLARPGALTAALNWYRANMHPRDTLEPIAELPSVAVPTLGVWGSGDIHLAEPCVTDSAARVSAEWRYQRLEGVGHWIPLDAPDRLIPLILEWLAPDGALLERA
jgi:pimeloyl-ACP methyl ester carboxylesterase